MGRTACLAAPQTVPKTICNMLSGDAVPVVPACTLWDGIVSCLRVYDPDELRGLISGLPQNDYHWECGRVGIPRMPAQLTYLIGAPA